MCAIKIFHFRSYLVATCGPAEAKKLAENLKNVWGFEKIVLIGDVDEIIGDEEGTDNSTTTTATTATTTELITEGGDSA